MALMPDIDIEYGSNTVYVKADGFDFIHITYDPDDNTFDVTVFQSTSQEDYQYVWEGSVVIDHNKEDN